MRNLVIFIRRYFNFFLFLLLEICCLSLVFRHNDYQRSAYLNSANQVTGFFFRKYNNVQYYFHLKAVNDSLAAQNAALLNRLPGHMAFPDTTVQVPADSAGRRQYVYLPARVVNNSVNTRVNYLTIYRGRRQGLQPGMGVIGDRGLVGIVHSVSDHYAVVMSVLHKDSRISAKLSRTGHFGSVRWEEEHPDPRYGTLTDIPKSVALHSGDSVVTSGYSAIFPPGILIGYVDKVTEDPSSNFHIIRIRFATDFRSLQYVYVIKNFLNNEQRALEDAVPHE